MATTYTVVKGDTLSEIALKYNTTVAKLVKLNNIKDPDFIIIGQVIKLDGTETSPTINRTYTANVDVFGLQSNTDRTVYAKWTWSQKNTEEYKIQWEYHTGDSIWFIGSDTSTNDNQAVYTAPSNADKVGFRVKPVSKKRKVNGKETSYWTAGWSTWKRYDFSNNPPETPSTPTVEVNNYTLTATLNNLDVNASKIQFQIIKNDKTTYKYITANITTNAAKISCTVAAGAEYKVRCRSYRDNMYSEWSEYSDNQSSVPAAPSGITVCRANSKTSIYLEWASVTSATSYELEYTTKKEYFDSSDSTTTVSDIKTTKYEKTGLETGNEYFFRVRAVNSKGSSSWSGIKSVVIGTDPAAPTTWSSTTKAVTGESLILHWVHNSEDGSSQTFAELELDINGIVKTHTIQNTTDEEEKDKTSTYVIDTTAYDEGVKIKWRVRTAGVTKTYGDWSIQRVVDIYAPATLQLNVTDSDGVDLEALTSFPFYVSALAGPNTQAPTGYTLTVVANETYETVDNIGNTNVINSGEEVYSKYFDISDPLLVEMSAGNIDLENNISYTVKCVVSMNSGLTAESTVDFTVSWEFDVDIYQPDAEIGIDEDTLSAYIRPHCWEEDVTLAVYRREFDGSFVEIASGIPNQSNTYITDPHPALDYARYRVVATSNLTGKVSYYDIPGYPIGEPSVVIQWDEEWSSFDTSSEDELEKPPWAGSMLKIPYNIDISDKYKMDVSLIEYIGRKRPVSYYGTQLGETSSWSMEIPKDDTETLYALRRLSIWQGDVYVREPSGSGYWASISISFNQKHCEVTIPISISVTRVEGGI